MIRFLLKLVVVFALLYVLVLGAFFILMLQPPEVFGRVMSRIEHPALFMLFPFPRLWMIARTGSLQAGDPAPDFQLKTPDGQQTIRLSSFQGRQPIVLVFGSYT